MKKELEKSKKIIVIYVILALVIGIGMYLSLSYFHVFTGKFIDEFGNLATENAVVGINFSQEIGIIRDDFYGANVHNFITSAQKIDANADGTAETDSNLAWHKQAWLDSEMKYMRWDMSLEDYYFFDEWDNLDFESWTNASIGFFDTAKESGTIGWIVEAYNGGQGFVSRSNDSHSGNYSLGVSGNHPSYVYIFRNVRLRAGKNYNFSAYVKANGTFYLNVQRLDNYANCASQIFSGNGTEWQLVSVSCPVLDSSTGYRLVIDDISPGEKVLIDDLNLKEDNEPYIPNYFFAGNLNPQIERLKWAHENNIRTLIIADYMPTWLADKNSEGCNQTKLTDCMPYDIEIWKNIVLDYLGRITENGTYASDVDVEVWNEPYGGFFLSGLSYDNLKKSVYYNRLYNSTYVAIKSRYPQIAVGGPSGYYSAPNMINGFLTNFSQQMDFVSVHSYLDTYESGANGFLNKTQFVLDLCEKYSANCSRVIYSEWNVDNILIKNSSENEGIYRTNIALAYADMLNNYPGNVSMVLYQWSENKKYIPTVNYPEYPQKWNMVSEPNLDNEFTPAYNVTKNFAAYHSKGSVVMRSNSSLSNIQVVASKKPNSQYITVINAGTDSNVSLNIFGNASSGIKDLETNETYIIKNNIVNIGIINQYQIRYFVNSSSALPYQNQTGNQTSPGGTGSSSGSGRENNNRKNSSDIGVNKTKKTRPSTTIAQDFRMDSNTSNIKPLKNRLSGFVALKNEEGGISWIGVILIFVILIGAIAIYLWFTKKARKQKFIRNK